MDIDEQFKRWIKQNNLDLEEYVSYFDWPSEWKHEPYFEILQHVLNDGHEEMPIPLADEFIAYALTRWSGTEVPINHPLVRDRQKWLDVCYDIEVDNIGDETTPQDVIKLQKLILSIAGPELKDNLASVDDMQDTLNSPTFRGGLYLFEHDGFPYHFGVNDEAAAFLDQDGNVKVFDFDGNRLHEGEDLERIRSWLIGGMKLSKPVTDPGELASILGNHLASLVLGEDSISILDLP